MPPSHHPRPTRRPPIVIKRESDQGTSDLGNIWGGSGGNSRGWLNTTPQWQWDRWGIPGRSGPGISVGTGTLPVLPTGVFIPQVVTGPTGPPQTPLSQPVIGVDPTSPSLVISESTVVPTTTQGTRTLKPFYVSKEPDAATRQRMEDLGYQMIVRPAPGSQPVPGATPTITPKAGGGSMPLDLGNLITDLGTAYITSKYAPQPQVVQAQPVDYQMGPINVDPFDLFTDPATGQVVQVKKKKCRRRRKRLATKSDLGDLAALKAILGNGEAFKAWIATHSR